MVGLYRHIRAHYFARWSKSARSNPRKISSRIAVAVREDTTFLAIESVLRSSARVRRKKFAYRVIRKVMQPRPISGTRVGGNGGHEVQQIVSFRDAIRLAENTSDNS